MLGFTEPYWRFIPALFHTSFTVRDVLVS